MHSSERPRELVCKVCDKAFVEKQNLQVHMKVHSDEKPYQCDQCGKQLKAKHSLDLHMASKHPELASEYGLKALARMQQRYKEISSKRKQENRVLKKRGPKPKKRKQESSESETESSEDYTEESETEWFILLVLLKAGLIKAFIYIIRSLFDLPTTQHRI